MKMFVRNDNRLYNITKWQRAFLYIMTKLQKNYKNLTKSYKSYKVVISISLWRSMGIHRTGAGVCPQWRSVSVYTSKGAAFGELGAAFDGVGSCVSKEAALQGKLRLSGALPLWEATTLDY